MARRKQVELDESRSVSGNGVTPGFVIDERWQRRVESSRVDVVEIERFGLLLGLPFST